MNNNNLLQIIFLLNSVLTPLALLCIDLDIKEKKKLSSLSDFVKVGRKNYLILELILISANLIQGAFCYYLYNQFNFPATVLFGTFAGLTGTVATLARIDKHKMAHIGLTIITCSMYTFSVLFTAFALNQLPLILVSLAQIVLFITGYYLKFRTKHLEVVYFYFLGLWNILVFLIFIRS